MTMVDIFSQIYKLKEEGKYRLALSKLVDNKTGRVKSPYTEDKNHAWYTIGDIFFKSRKYYEAIRAFQKAHKYWTDDVEALWAIANCYSELGKPWLAKYYLIKAIAINGKKDELRYNLGNALFDMEEYEDAVREYKKVGKNNKKLCMLAASNIEKAKRKIKKQHN